MKNRMKFKKARRPPQEVRDSECFRSFEALADSVLNDLYKQFGHLEGLHMVCGPISRGGTRNLVYNMEILNAGIELKQAEGLEVFVQTVREPDLWKLIESAWLATGHIGYCVWILTRYYLTVFKGGKRIKKQHPREKICIIRHAWFVYGWKTSRGTRWERKILRKLGTVIHDLSREDVRTALERKFPHDPEHVELLMSLLPKPKKAKEPKQKTA